MGAPNKHPLSPFRNDLGVRNLQYLEWRFKHFGNSSGEPLSHLSHLIERANDETVLAAHRDVVAGLATEKLIDDARRRPFWHYASGALTSEIIKRKLTAQASWGFDDFDASK